MADITRQEIANALDSAVRTIRDDATYLERKKYVHPTVVSGRPTTYPGNELEIFRQLRSHCANGFDRKSFVPNVELSVVKKSDLVVVSRHRKRKDFFENIYREFCHRNGREASPFSVAEGGEG